MDTTEKKYRKVNPAKSANVFSLLTFLYMFPIFKRSFKNGVREEDLFRPLDEHNSQILGEKLEKVWTEQHRKHKKSALHRALFKLFGPQFIILGILKGIDEVMLVVLIPLSIGRLVSYFGGGRDDISETEAYLQALAIVLCLVLDAFISHPSMMGFMHITMKMRVSCSSLLYRKALRLSQTALASTTIGQLVNLLSNDVSRFDQGFLLAHYVWIGPIQAAVGTYLIYREIGVAAFFGIGFLLSFIPMQIWLGKRTSVLRLRTALRTDERVRLMNEVISGIQVIKMYCWEKPFSQLIAYARKKEMNTIRAHAFLLGLIYSFEMFVTRTSVFISILGYVLLGSYITAEKVFTVKAIYDVLRPVITILFSVSITSIAEVNVSVLRIQKFLSFAEHELEKPKLFKNGVSKNGSNGSLVPYHSPVEIRPRILVESVNAKWLKTNNESTLKDINLSISSNQVVAVIGPVGSGKSSLLNVFLKELPLESGKLDIQGTISYSSQEPWLFSASVRQNILFGNEYDEERYKQVVEVCALLSDFELFPYGDKTLVGEKGKALSGGQKARINLARAIYKKADIYLLDDPLSAVDANVGKHLYERCVKGFLKDKICILITHQLQYLSSADKIIIMKDGKIEMQGTYTELQTSGLDFAKLLEQFHIEEEEEKDKKKAKSRQNSECTVEKEEENEEPSIEKEQMKSGSIKGKLYLEYLRAGGGKIMITLLALAFLIGQFIANAGDYYVSYWVNLEQQYSERILNNLTKENETLERLPIIFTYSGIILGTIIFSVVHSLYFMLYFIIASINLHRISFSSIIKATMRFYNNNPSGRILNRFSKDLGYIDEYIPPVLFDVIEVGLMLIGALFLSFIVDPWLFVPSMILITIFYFLRVVYIRTSRSVKRIEGITRSPIYSHLTASMHGLSTIRAFSAQKILINEFDNFQDNHSAAWFLFIASNRCFGFWLDVICIIFFAVAIFVLMYFNKSIYGGDIGLIVTQYIMLIGSLQWGMRQWSELENHMVSVERLLEYRSIESEPERKQITNLPKEWPQQGRIEFQNVYLKYNLSDPYVLKNLNFIVEPKEKIGIVGRTGAGKSSTITALFQLYPIEGSIIIDGVDTTKLPLEEARSKISIIPQEPVLFSGTMRKNLDPFEEFTDEMLWNALEQVELKDVVSELPAGLHSNVSEGGSNFSVGQRQLVCLARALIRNNKILVMDEATANVDPHTDALIQNTIRDKFSNCTVLTIAHRLHTVMDSDKILVMNAGSVEEYDHPYNLLRKEGGILHNLVQTTGKATASNLENIAKESFEKKIKTE
ncbi:probable multidrug resistance-associated protein lethal(2)03659 isoform X2 [Tribolium madens]|uniref:probable multidrug resistance-associated protein lethal(2)03659 isoform X2 n=1 Tax=Tribolium madens TaxID=41895 RepID=UPI001CF732B7|nr:probable multidrug resistance-associated protein lethal(2)03659 isoform X2 [Tribolium madens]